MARNNARETWQTQTSVILAEDPGTMVLNTHLQESFNISGVAGDMEAECSTYQAASAEAAVQICARLAVLVTVAILEPMGEQQRVKGVIKPKDDSWMCPG